MESPLINSNSSCVVFLALMFSISISLGVKCQGGNITILEGEGSSLRGRVKGVAALPCSTLYMFKKGTTGESIVYYCADYSRFEEATIRRPPKDPLNVTPF
jgi:hypothetical protein